MNDLISIAIVANECREIIVDCLESILKQTCKKYELIIIDNATNDGTLEVLTEYMHKFINAGVFCRLTRNRYSYDNQYTANMAYAPSIGDYVIQITPEMRLPMDFVDNILNIIKEKKPGAIILSNKECPIEKENIILDFKIKSGQIIESRFVRSNIGKHRETFMTYRTTYQVFLYSIIDKIEVINVDYEDKSKEIENKNKLLDVLEKYRVIYACKRIASLYKKDIHRLLEDKTEEIKKECIQYSQVMELNDNKDEVFRFQQLAKLF